MSYEALDWWHEHSHEYVDLRREPVLYAITTWLARRMHKDPWTGAYPSQDELAQAAQLRDRQAVKAATDELVRRGVIIVRPNDAPKVPGKRGPRGHRYQFLALLPIPGTAPNDVPGIASPNTGDGHASDPRHSESEYRGSEGPIPGIRGSNTGDGHAQDPAGRGLEGSLEGGRACAPTSPRFVKQCSAHQDATNDDPCLGCKRARIAFEAAQASDPVRVLADRVLADRMKWYRRHPTEGVVPTRSDALRWARELTAHTWCGDCDELTRSQPNEYDGVDPCVCKPPYRCDCASPSTAEVTR